MSNAQSNVCFHAKLYLISKYETSEKNEISTRAHLLHLLYYYRLKIVIMQQI